VGQRLHFSIDDIDGTVPDKMKWFSPKCSEKIPDQRFSCDFFAVNKYFFKLAQSSYTQKVISNSSVDVPLRIYSLTQLTLFSK